MLDSRIRKLERLLAKEGEQNVRIVVAFKEEDGSLVDRHTGETWENVEACKAALGEHDTLILICVEAGTVGDRASNTQGGAL